MLGVPCIQQGAAGRPYNVTPRKDIRAKVPAAPFGNAVYGFAAVGLQVFAKVFKGGTLGADGQPL